MKIILHPTEVAVESFPDETFDVVETNYGIINIGKSVTCTSDIYTYLSQLVFSHPETGFSCRYFDIDIVEHDRPRPDFSQTAGTMLTEEVKLFQAVIAVVDSQLPSISDKTATYIAIYNATTTRVQGAINGQV